MKNKAKILFTAISTILVTSLTLSTLAFNSLASAASDTATLSVSPSSQSVTTGGNVVVSVVVNPGGNSINSINTLLSYPSSKFSLVSISAGPSFGTFIDTPGSGDIAITAGNITAITTTQTVATITLNATAAGAGLPITLASCLSSSANSYSLSCSAAYDALASGQPNDLSGVNSGSITVNNPASGSSGSSSTPPSSSSSTSSSKASSASSDKSSTNNTSSATPAAAVTTSVNPVPSISDLTVDSVTADSATISWRTNVASNTLVNYGLNANFGLVAQSSALTTSHTITLDSPKLSQGITYYFQAISKTSSGASASSNTMQFTTTGYTVTLTIVDGKGKPISGATVIIGDQTEISNSSGIVTFQNVPAGNRSVTIKSGTSATVRSIYVGKANVSLQQFSLLATRGAKSSTYYVITLLVLVVGVVFMIFFGPKGIIHRIIGTHGADDYIGPAVVVGGKGTPPNIASPVASNYAPPAPTEFHQTHIEPSIAPEGSSVPAPVSQPPKPEETNSNPQGPGNIITPEQK